MANVPFVPDWTVPAGRYLARYLRDRPLGEDEIAERSGLTVEHVRGLINGTIPFDPFFAVRIGAALGVDPEFWLRAQAAYEADLARGATPAPLPPPPDKGSHH